MAEVSEDGGALSQMGEANNGCSTFPDWTPTAMQSAPLTVWGLFKEGKSSSRRTSVRPSLDADEFINLLHGSDPVKVELNRLKNEVRGAKCGSIRCVSSLILLALISV
ncbi:hypothetical protein SO802_008775 [Lithocarpus litseifolius]|uniref:Uncharacterized protein n=1 Tax=Lithocarpus litseifolius TaxID=425828 RepID=A0AAW2DC58_9ROSI